MVKMIVSGCLTASVLLLPSLMLARPSLTQAAVIRYETPPETATFPPGPNRELVEANCSGCHSADYQSTQPRGMANVKAFWSAEVTKMRKVYGASIDDDDAAKIVAYLVEVYR